MDIVQVNKKAYKISFWVHVCIIVILLVVSMINDFSCPTKKQEDSLEVEFTVDVSTQDIEQEQQIDDLVAPPEVVPIEEEPAPIPVQPKADEPKPDKPKRKPIKISDKVVHINKPKVREERPAPTSTKENKLTDEEIKKLLDMGAKPSDHTSVPGERERCFSIIKNKLYSAWRRPSLSPTDVASAAELTIWLGDKGVIKKYKLSRSSGNHEMDASVESAAKAVRRIPELTPSFIRDYKTITINFVLE